MPPWQIYGRLNADACSVRPRQQAIVMNLMSRAYWQILGPLVDKNPSFVVLQQRSFTFGELRPMRKNYSSNDIPLLFAGSINKTSLTLFLQRYLHVNPLENTQQFLTCLLMKSSTIMTANTHTRAHRERERERDRNIDIHTYACTRIYIQYESLIISYRTAVART
jgi:hypothetical protein